MFLKTVPVLLFVGAAAFVTSSTIRDTRAEAAFKGVAIVTVHAKEFGFTAPKTIPAGMTTFKLVNDGKELHHLTVIKLAPGKTAADFANAMKKPGPMPKWMTAMGGPNAAVPGSTIDATLNLEPGTYMLICVIPSPGEQAPHMSKGMVAQLDVVPASGVQQAGVAYGPAPVPDVHLELKDYGFAFSKPITAGKHTIHIMNDGPQDHEAVIVQLAPGKHIADFTTWIDAGMKGPPPGKPIAGIAFMAKGRTAVVTDDFAPGNYGITCFVPAPDGKVHAQHGMNLDFTVK